VVGADVMGVTVGVDIMGVIGVDIIGVVGVVGVHLIGVHLIGVPFYSSDKNLERNDLNLYSGLSISSFKL
jgi:lactate dehydrogenase-like 2-hydroxyacid dehydrogenase